MHLEKWYADVVDDGAAHVFYRAELKLGPLHIGYAGHVRHGSGRAERAYTVGTASLPRMDGERIVFTGRDGHGAMAWSGARSRPQVLWRKERQQLSWDPLVCNGRVEGPGLSPAARGYVERLRIDFAPWRLGLQRLRWGRFCGAVHSLVWIEWEGEHPLRLALLDGERVPLHAAHRDRVRASGAELDFTTTSTLVHERLDEGALRGLPLPRRLAGLRFLQGAETKWLSEGHLRLADGRVNEGHSIHEEVTWP